MRSHATRLFALLFVLVASTASAGAAVIHLGTATGNDSLVSVNQLIGSYNAANGASHAVMTDLLAKWDCSSECAGFTLTDGAVQAETFGVATSRADNKAGTWTFEGAEGWLAGAYVVKAGPGFSVFLLDPAIAATSTAIDWHTYDLFVGRNNNNPMLSHLSWYGLRGGAGGDCGGEDCVQGCDDGSCGTTPVPEAASLVVTGLGLLVAAIRLRRRQA